MKGQPHDAFAVRPLSRSDSLNSSTSSLSRQLSDSSSDFEDLLDEWKAEVAAQEARNAAGAAGARTSNGVTSADAAASTSGGAAGDSGAAAGGSGGTGGSAAAHGSGSPAIEDSSASGGGAAAVDNHNRQDPAHLQAAAALPQPLRRPSSASTPPPKRLPATVGAGAGRRRGNIGGASMRSLAAESSSASFGPLKTAAGSSQQQPRQQQQQRLRRRAAFVAGSVSSTRKPGTNSAPPRDILLPRLPAPALDLIIPALPPATRAALRLTSKLLRALVDCHTRSLAMRPDRRAADALNKRGTKAFALFPVLRHVTVVLAGSCSGPTGPTGSANASAAAPAAAAQPPQPAAADAAGPVAGGRQTSASQASSAGAAMAGASTGSALLSLTGWLVVCGTARCLTSLTMHVGEVGLLEDLALSVAHPHLQRLDLFIGRSGNPHATPPLIQFSAGVLPRLRHLGITWAAGPGGGGNGGDGGAGAVPSLATLAHGARRLFLDGRPRLGPLLLAALGDLTQLESLELRGFLIDTDGHAVLARHWPVLAGRLRRLVLSGLHLMVPNDTPPGEQLGELVGECGQLRELHADLRLPASVGMPGAAAAAVGQGGAAAAALLLSLMYASRDVRAVRPEFLPLSLTRLSLPGVCLTSPEDLAPLSRLRSLTSLEVTALGAGAGEYLTALQELRLVECHWKQLYEMLPWLPAPAVQQQLQPTCAARSSAALGAARTAAAAPPAGPVAAWTEPAAQARQAVGPPRAGAASASAAGSRGGGISGRSVAGTTAAQATGAVSTEAETAAACGQLRSLEAMVVERLDDWQAADRALLAKLGKALLPLADGGCRLRLKVAPDAQPHIWNESDEDGQPWEPVAVRRSIQAEHHHRRLQAETKAAAERMARGRLLQAARRKDRQWQVCER